MDWLPCEWLFGRTGANQDLAGCRKGAFGSVVSATRRQGRFSPSFQPSIAMVAWRLWLIRDGVPHRPSLEALTGTFLIDSESMAWAYIS